MKTRNYCVDKLPQVNALSATPLLIVMKLKHNTDAIKTTIDAFSQRYHLLALIYAEQVKFVLESNMAPLMVNGDELQVSLFCFM